MTIHMTKMSTKLNDMNCYVYCRMRFNANFDI